MTGKHVARRQTETSDYAAMLTRMIYAYGTRIADDPGGLVHLAQLRDALTDAADMGIAAANDQDLQPDRAQRYSINEMAAILGVSKQAVHKRVVRGRPIVARLKAAQGPLVRVRDLRQARAAALRAAGVTDRTGSPRELSAGQGDL